MKYVNIFAFSRTFTKGDAFIGYHEDCVPAVVLQVCAECHEDGSDLSDVEREAWEEKVLLSCYDFFVPFLLSLYIIPSRYDMFIFVFLLKENYCLYS